MALPFFTISILLFQMPIGEAFAQWAWQTWAYEMSLAIVLGTLIGYASRYLLRYSETHNFIDKRNFFSFEIALTVRFLNQKAHAHSFSSWDWQASFTCPPLSPSWLRVSRLHGTGGLPPKQRKHMYMGQVAAMQQHYYQQLQHQQQVCLSVCMSMSLPLCVCLYAYVCMHAYVCAFAGGVPHWRLCADR